MSKATPIDNSLLNPVTQEVLKEIFFKDYNKGLLRTDISEKEILKLNRVERYNLWYICYLKAISLIPTIEMAKWIKENFNPQYDICGGAGNLGFTLGIPSTDSYFRLTDKFKDRMDTLKNKVDNDVLMADFTVCKNTECITANNVAKREDVDTVIGSWILVRHPDKNVNKAIEITDIANRNPIAVTKMNISKKLTRIILQIHRKGTVGIPNGIHLKNLLENANLVFIGNSEIHSKQHVKELYNPYPHKVYNSKDLPFKIIDKVFLRGIEDKGFIRYFKKIK